MVINNNDLPTITPMDMRRAKGGIGSHQTIELIKPHTHIIRN